MILYYKDEDGNFLEYGTMKEGIWMTKKEIDGTYSYYLESEDLPKAYIVASLVPSLRWLAFYLNKYLLSRMEIEEIKMYDIKASHLIKLIQKAIEKAEQENKLEKIRES